MTINYVNSENKWHVKSFRVKYNPKELIEFLFSVWRSVSPESIGIERTIYDKVKRPGSYVKSIALKPTVNGEIVEILVNNEIKWQRGVGDKQPWEI